MNVRVGGLVLRNDAVLLIRHDYEGGQLWHFPGGGVREHETLTDALRREFREELGVEVKVGILWLVCDSIRADGVHVLHCVFVVDSVEGEPVIQKAETSGVERAWVPVAKLSSLYLYPSIGTYVKQSTLEHPSTSPAGYIGRCKPRTWL